MPTRRSTSKKRSKRALASIDPDPPLSQETSLLQSIGSGEDGEGEGEKHGLETSAKLQEVAESAVESVQDAVGEAKDFIEDATTAAAPTRRAGEDGQEAQEEEGEKTAESQPRQATPRGRRGRGKGKAKEPKEPAAKKDSRAGRKRKRKDAEETAEEPAPREGGEEEIIKSSVSSAPSSSTPAPAANRFGSLRGNVSLLNLGKIFDRAVSSSSSINGPSLSRNQTSSDSTSSLPQQSQPNSEKPGGFAKRLFGGIFSRPSKKLKLQHEGTPADAPAQTSRQASAEAVDENQPASALYPDTTKLEQEQRARLGEPITHSAEAGPSVGSIYPVLPQAVLGPSEEGRGDTDMPDVQDEAAAASQPVPGTPNGKGRNGKAEEDAQAPSRQNDAHSSQSSASSPTTSTRRATLNGRSKSPKSPHLTLLTPDSKPARNSRSRAVLLANQKEREKAVDGKASQQQAESEASAGEEDAGSSQEAAKQRNAGVDGSDAPPSTKEEVEHPNILGADESRGLIALLDGRRDGWKRDAEETPDESVNSEPQQAESAALEEERGPRGEDQGAAQEEVTAQNEAHKVAEPADAGQDEVLAEESEPRGDEALASASGDAISQTETEAEEVEAEEEDADDDEILISGPGIPSSQNIQIDGERLEEELGAEAAADSEDTGELIDRSRYDENGVALLNGSGASDPDAFDEILFADEADSFALPQDADKENRKLEVGRSPHESLKQGSRRMPLGSIDLTGDSDEDEEDAPPQEEDEEEGFEEQEDEIILKPSQLPRKPSSTALRGPLARSLSSRNLVDSSLNESFDHLSIRHQQQHRPDYLFDSSFADTSATDMIAAIGASVIYKSPLRAKVMLNRKQPRRKRDPIGLKEHKMQVEQDRQRVKQTMLEKIRKALRRLDPRHQIKLNQESMQMVLKKARIMEKVQGKTSQQVPFDELLEKSMRDILLRRQQDALSSIGPSMAKQTEYERLRREKRARERALRGVLGRKPLPARLTDEQEEEVNKIFRARGTVSTMPGAQVTSDDVSRLKPGCWLNDESINFYGVLVLNRSKVAAEEREKAKKAGKKPDIKWRSFWDIHFFNSFFYSKLEKDGFDSVKRWTRKVDVFSKDIALFPVNLGNNHWVTGAINFRQKRIEYYDSLHSSNKYFFAEIRDYLERESLDKRKIEMDWTGWEDYSPDSPQQNNGSDCGVFTICTIEQLSRRDPLISMPSPLGDGSASGNKAAKPDEDEDDDEYAWNFSAKNMPYMRRRIVYELWKKELLDY